jgi:hypothetical protein
VKKKAAEHHFTVRLKTRADFPRLKGSRTEETRQVLADRDELIRRAVHVFCSNPHDFPPGRSFNPAADYLYGRWHNYETNSWPRERHCVVCPPRRVGTPEGIGWEILRIHRIPAVGHLRKIISRVAK